MGEWKCNQEVIMCSIKVVQTSFCTKPKPSFKLIRQVSFCAVIDHMFELIIWDTHGCSLAWTAWVDYAEPSIDNITKGNLLVSSQQFTA